MAKFWSFDVRTGIDILLESEAKIEKKTLYDSFVFWRALTFIRIFYSFKI